MCSWAIILSGFVTTCNTVHIWPTVNIEILIVLICAALKKSTQLQSCKLDISDETTSRYFSCIFASVWINTNLQQIRSNLQNITENDTKRRREKGGKKRVSLQSVPKQNFSAAMILSAGSVEVLYRARYRTYIIGTKIPIRQRKCDKGGMVRILCAVWRNWKLCVFGIHVTALLKNASKQLQNSWDWVWAHKVVTIIQTSVVRMEGSCCL